MLFSRSNFQSCYLRTAPILLRFMVNSLDVLPFCWLGSSPFSAARVARSVGGCNFDTSTPLMDQRLATSLCFCKDSVRLLDLQPTRPVQVRVMCYSFTVSGLNWRVRSQATNCTFPLEKAESFPSRQLTFAEFDFSRTNRGKPLGFVCRRAFGYC